jgi:hypothetical protein
MQPTHATRFRQGTIGMTDNQGVKRLLRRGRRRFRIEENTAYYNEQDLKEAEKRFLIECVLRDRCHLTDT